MNLSSIASAIAPVNLRSCLISRQGRLVFEHYRDRQTAGQIAKINSCTKSFLSALICIAFDQGLLPSADTPISEFFPQLLDEDDDPRKRQITLRHLLTMSAGFNWTEFGGHNSFPRMTRSADWVRFALEQPMSDHPGDRMEYNSGASQLLAAILVQAAGLPAARFAELHLFGPLGIEAYKWEQDPQGVHTGGFGLWLRPGDMLKFGQLYLQRGVWEGKPLISTEMVSQSVKPAIGVEAPRRGCYAWHWWTDTWLPAAGPGEDNMTSASDPARDGGRFTASSPSPAFDYFYARGYGGNFIYVIPSLETVVVLTDDKRKRDRPPADVFRQLIAPHI
ncbi:serine hydrolase [Paenibacillus macerans]|uniref:serine hydrolase domain-containing protein n=1 Tax=Paenibacillus macerans TaxID=44252 RepID=UPI00203D71AC|nr:serine hydrolase [Paenibacillus macerans]MCM3697981.1 beta-lactamase family protein [Paenibacillus macerans]